MTEFDTYQGTSTISTKTLEFYLHENAIIFCEDLSYLIICDLFEDADTLSPHEIITFCGSWHELNVMVYF
jgi:hypothetical protein